MMRYHGIALFTVLVWGLTFVQTKVLLIELTPLWILLIRFAIGFACLCALRPHVLRMKERRHELLFILAGATGVGAYYLFENVALVFTTATTVGVIVSASPLSTTLFSALRGDREVLSARFFVGFAFAMCGLVLVAVGSDLEGLMQGFTSPAALLGDLLALLAALVWSVYSLTIKRISDLGYETIAVTKRTFLWGLVLIVPATLIFGGPAPVPSVLIEPQNIGNLLFLGFVASAMCFVTWGVAVKRLGPVISSTYIYLVPAITATASIILLGEPFSTPIVVGVILTIVGLVLSDRR